MWREGEPRCLRYSKPSVILRYLERRILEFTIALTLAFMLAAFQEKSFKESVFLSVAASTYRDTRTAVARGSSLEQTSHESENAGWPHAGYQRRPLV